MALRLQVKQRPHGLAAAVTEGGALHNGDVSRLPALGHIAGVETLGPL